MKNLLINSLCLQFIEHSLANLAVGIYENNIVIALVIVITHTHTSYQFLPVLLLLKSRQAGSSSQFQVFLLWK